VAERASGIGQFSDRVDECSGPAPFDGGGPIVGRPPACLLQVFGIVLVIERDHHVGLDAVETHRGERGNVPVATVLPQRRAELPERGDRIVGPRDAPVRREQRPPGGATALDRVLEIRVDDHGDVGDRRNETRQSRRACR
jgi:hypothetical protein